MINGRGGKTGAGASVMLEDNKQKKKNSSVMEGNSSTSNTKQIRASKSLKQFAWVKVQIGDPEKIAQRKRLDWQASEPAFLSKTSRWKINKLE